jgi:hypothetical protein
VGKQALTSYKLVKDFNGNASPKTGKYQTQKRLHQWYSLYKKMK